MERDADAGEVRGAESNQMKAGVRIVDSGTFVFDDYALEEERRERMADYVELAALAVRVDRAPSSFKNTVESMGYNVEKMFRDGKYVNVVDAVDAQRIIDELMTGPEDRLITIEELDE